MAVSASFFAQVVAPSNAGPYAKPHKFSFDHVFNQDTTQADVFNVSIRVALVFA